MKFTLKIIAAIILITLTLAALTACGDTPKDPDHQGPHEYVSISETLSTCSEAGIVTFRCVLCHLTYEEALPLQDHTFTEPSCIASKTCTVCGFDTGYYGDHIYNETYTQPTCTEDGGYTISCQVCDFKDGSVDPAYGHQFYVSSEIPATVYSEGSIEHVCSVCNETKSTPTERLSPDSVFRPYLFFCRDLGEFASVDELTGPAFFNAFTTSNNRNDAVIETGGDYFDFFTVYDVAKIDEFSLSMVGKIFDYSDVSSLNKEIVSRTEYTYDKDKNTITVTVSGGGGGGGDDIYYIQVYDGYEQTSDNTYTINYHYKAEVYGDYYEVVDTYDTDVTGKITVELVEQAFLIRSHTVNGSLSN